MSSFTYNLNIPNGPNNPSADQPLMQTNTNSINSIISVDHFPFQSTGQQDGYHKQVSLVNQAAPGVPANANGVLFSNIANTLSFPFWQNSLGNFSLASTTPSLINFITSLPGGFIIQFGIVNGSHGGDNHFVSGDTGTVTFVNAFPTALNFVFTQPVWNSAVNTAPLSQATFAVDNNPAKFLKTAFSWSLDTGSSSYTSFFWVAIGQ